jgi:hypothetical protein
MGGRLAKYLWIAVPVSHVKETIKNVIFIVDWYINQKIFTVSFGRLNEPLN